MEQRPLHWSERAKMYPAAPDGGAGGSRGAARPQRQKGPGRKSAKAKSSRKGFLVALVLVALVAAAAAVLFLWYLPNKDTGSGDPELDARSLVRQAMTALDNAYTDAHTFDPQTLTPTALKAVSASIVFQPLSDTSAATDPSARAKDQAVNYAGTQTSYAVGTVSESGRTYGAVVDHQNNTVTYYVDGQPVDDWDQTSATTTAATTPQTTTDTSHSQVGPVLLASDVEAMALVRNAMTVIQSAYQTVSTYEPATMTTSLLQQMDPSIVFTVRDDDSAAKAPASVTSDNSVDFYGTATTYALGTRSQSGKAFGVVVGRDANGEMVTYYVNGQLQDWIDQMVTPVT